MPPAIMPRQPTSCWRRWRSRPAGRLAGSCWARCRRPPDALSRRRWPGTRRWRSTRPTGLATLRLGLIGEATDLATPPSAFVETLFDQYADTFDAALVEKLAYRVPALLSEAIHMQGGRMFGL